MKKIRVARRRLLIFIAITALIVFNSPMQAVSITGEPRCEYKDEICVIDPDHDITNITVYNNDATSFRKMRNHINITEWSIITGYEIGYNSNGTQLNVTIESPEKNKSISEIREIPANDPSNKTIRIFDGNSDQYLITNKALNISIEVEQGNNSIEILAGNNGTISNNSYLWSNEDTTWERYLYEEFYLAPMTERMQNLTINKTTSHVFNANGPDGNIDAFYLNINDLSRDSPVFFTIRKTKNMEAGNLSIELYFAESGVLLNEIDPVNITRIRPSQISFSIPFDQTIYSQDFILIVRSPENKPIGYNITMLYENPIGDGGGLTWLEKNAGLLTIIIVGVIAVGGITFYIWKRKQ